MELREQLAVAVHKVAAAEELRRYIYIYYIDYIRIYMYMDRSSQTAAVV